MNLLPSTRHSNAFLDTSPWRRIRPRMGQCQQKQDRRDESSQKTETSELREYWRYQDNHLEEHKARVPHQH